MKNRIEQLEIKNFKSLKHVNFKCKRINIFIGKPNVGKSNILEALSLFIAPNGEHNKKLLEDYVRYENLRNLFFDQDRKNQIEVITNLGFASLRFPPDSVSQYDIMIGPEIGLLKLMKSEEGLINLNDPNSVFSQYINKIDTKKSTTKPYYNWIGEDGKMHQGMYIERGYTTPIKKYHFKSITNHANRFSLFLRPPFGDNLYAMLEDNPKLYDECTHFFNEYKLDLLLDTVNEKLEVQKRVGNKVYKIPYSLAADTLQRYIFYLMAIETNKDSILLFEEPEAHCFPPYIQQMSQRIIDSEANQFFITTHSPFVLNTIIENAKSKDVTVFTASYKNFQTHITPLSDKELSEMLNYGYDIFSHIK
jgi:AAA15 family ATPase/GTPase